MRRGETKSLTLREMCVCVRVCARVCVCVCVREDLLIQAPS